MYWCFSRNRECTVDFMSFKISAPNVLFVFLQFTIVTSFTPLSEFRRILVTNTARFIRPSTPIQPSTLNPLRTSEKTYKTSIFCHYNFVLILANLESSHKNSAFFQQVLLMYVVVFFCSHSSNVGLEPVQVFFSVLSALQLRLVHLLQMSFTEAHIQMIKKRFKIILSSVNFT